MLSRERPERELCVQSAAFVYALLWWPTVAWHGAKWRLCSKLCSPWEIGKPRKDAGVLELVALIARYAVLLTKQATSLASFGFLELTAIALALASIGATAKAAVNAWGVEEEEEEE